MNEHDYAEYLASCDEDRLAKIEDEYGKNPTCGWCGETAIDPVLHAEGTFGEEVMCRACDDEVEAIPYHDDGEDERRYLRSSDYGIGVSDAYLEGPDYWD